MGYPTTVIYKGDKYYCELDYQYNYLYGLAEISHYDLLDELGIEYTEDDWDDIMDMYVTQDIPEDEKLIDPMDE